MAASPKRTATIHISFSPGPQFDHLFPLLDRKLGRQFGMLRAIQNHVASTLKCREIIGIEIHVVLLRKSAKRAPISRHLRPSLAVRSHHNPLLQQRVPP